MKAEIKTIFKSFALSLSFLSRIPTPAFNPENKEWRIMPAFFPLTGALICVISALPVFPVIISANKFMISDEIADAFAAAVFIAFNLWLTRALHIDGFCDSVDAFAVVSADKEERLRILKDPHCGSAALSSLILLLGIKFISVFFILRQSRFYDLYSDFPFTALAIALIAISSSRFAISFLSFTGKYPRKTGTAMKIVGNTSFYALIFALITSLIPILFFKIKLFPAISVLIMLSVIVSLNILFWFFNSKKMIGGITGDILGAASETTETTLFALFAFAFNILFQVN